MGLGVFSGICAIVRTIKLAAYQSALDYTWTSGESILWSGAEMNVIIICACVPTFLPLIQQVTGQRDYRSKPTADPITYRSGQQQLMRNKTSMQLLKPQTTKKSTKSQESERSLPDGAISRTTEIESRWESV
ncbi:hypothetical protein MMC14_006803 [Varicellaria rhodocarpa]|nr:hypothetical protein [Varicellaria rhodocarpa]